ncbi:hypothetical protein FNF27_02265 [Cafeteria roenbergensis]|uniref:Nucleoside phosphorylase domain-containing protein n=1 Tax=Cafeteria roenbergensis TaxID=33653 RepID=A0A5A8CN71_CAFRO|nr:hypothetical protein FNF29_02413 [Cafeteria roenbergensis]KAA0176208.1 hypothetical protein FNF27_02265 [Cafeteria roenbergensis]|eukprot:KAA0154536.1 hypothetical protein FNF29_02413 [Cafeteria roenbergensis]
MDTHSIDDAASMLAPFPKRAPVLTAGVQLPAGVDFLRGDAEPMHVKASPNGIKGAYGILAGDPGRIAKIAALFDDPAEVATNRGFTVWRGQLDGVNVFAAAHGIGSASAAIVFEELALLGCHTLIRVGTCGSLQAGMRVGDVVVSTGCIRDDGTTRAYLPAEFPAVASHELVTALRLATMGAEGDRPPWVGVTHCKGSFYSEVPGYVPDAAAADARWAAWVGGGAVATEMEGAALFAIGGARNMRTGMVLAVLGVTKKGPGAADESTAEAVASILTDSEEAAAGKTRAIRAAVDALRVVIRHDVTAATAGAAKRVEDRVPAAVPLAAPRAAKASTTRHCPHHGHCHAPAIGIIAVGAAAFGALAALAATAALRRAD